MLSVCDLAAIFGSVCVLGCVWFWFSALSMLPKSTFYVAKRDVYG
jgi:hypothetical protein